MGIGLGMDMAKQNLPHETPEGVWVGGLYKSVGHAACLFHVAKKHVANVLAIINHTSGVLCQVQLPVSDGIWVSKA